MKKIVKCYIENELKNGNYDFVKEYPIKYLSDIEIIIDLYRDLHYVLKYNFVLDGILVLLFTEF